MPKIYIKPNIDAEECPLKVRLFDKPTQFLPEGGALVEKNSFWVRRLRDKSVILAEPSAELAPSTEPKLSKAVTGKTAKD
ncbi:MAG: DUF2635 domain-containing protein [Desulfobulbia bacterium]